MAATTSHPTEASHPSGKYSYGTNHFEVRWDNKKIIITSLGGDGVYTATIEPHIDDSGWWAVYSKKNSKEILSARIKFELDQGIKFKKIDQTQYELKPIEVTSRSS